MVYVEWQGVLQALDNITHDGVFVLFVILLLFDFITGTGKAIVNKEMNSAIGTIGLIKHITILLLVLLISVIGIIAEFQFVGYMFITFYIFEYVTSILENLDGMGVKFPNWLRDRLVQMKNKHESDSEKWRD